MDAGNPSGNPGRRAGANQEDSIGSATWRANDESPCQRGLPSALILLAAQCVQSETDFHRLILPVTLPARLARIYSYGSAARVARKRLFVTQNALGPLASTFHNSEHFAQSEQIVKRKNRPPFAEASGGQRSVSRSGFYEGSVRASRLYLRQPSRSSNVQSRSVTPAAIAGVTRILPGRQQKLK